MSESKSTDPAEGEIVHEYDGIQEADNQLPRWWLGIFFVTIAFAFGYWITYESWHFASSPREAYEEELARAAARGGIDVSDGLLAQLADNDDVVASGRMAFETNCAACHGARAEGRIGPNLTDGRWLHGGAPTDIYRTIREGFLARGMPAWGPALGERKVQALAAFVLTLRDTNVPGRAPEGETWSPEVPSAQEASAHPSGGVELARSASRR
jgi:cytochrome c oxidase cbb3-type subunit III